MRYDILKLEKFRVNKWDLSFDNKPKLDWLFVLIVVQFGHCTLVVLNVEEEGKKNYKKKISVIPGTIKADL